MGSAVKKGLSFLCMLAILITAMGLTTSVSASKADDLQNKINQLEKKQNEVKKKLEQAKKEKNQAQKEKNLIAEQVDNIKQQIDAFNSRIDALNDDIAAAQKQIIQKETEIKENQQIFKERLQAMYITGGLTNLQMLLGSTNLSDFLARTEIIKSISRHDQQVIDAMKKDLEAIKAQKATVESKKADVLADRQKVDKKKKELDVIYSESKHALDEINQEVNDYNADIKWYQKEIDEADAELDRYFASLNQTSGYQGGAFAWPVPGFSKKSNISSPFGWRQSTGTYHKGIDIAEYGKIPGAKIVAAADGEVTRVQYLSSGYGHNVIIDHGKPYATLYGHCDAIYVKTGQKVKKGDVIATVGNTGRSYGYHLHFEIRKNGTAVDPMNYFTLK